MIIVSELTEIEPSSEHTPTYSETRSSVFFDTPSSKYLQNDVPGSIHRNIGTGENAKTGIAWQTISWSFTGFAFLSLVAIFFPPFGFGQELETVMEAVKSAASIFLPIVTLALGYVFGSSNNR